MFALESACGRMPYKGAGEKPPPASVLMRSEHARQACAAWGLPTIGRRTSPEAVGSQGVSNCRCCCRICCLIRRSTLRGGGLNVGEVLVRAVPTLRSLSAFDGGQSRPLHCKCVCECVCNVSWRMTPILQVVGMDIFGVVFWALPPPPPRSPWGEIGRANL